MRVLIRFCDQSRLERHEFASYFCWNSCGRLARIAAVDHKQQGGCAEAASGQQSAPRFGMQTCGESLANQTSAGRKRLRLHCGEIEFIERTPLQKRAASSCPEIFGGTAGRL